MAQVAQPSQPGFVELPYLFWGVQIFENRVDGCVSACAPETLETESVFPQAKDAPWDRASLTA